jgi:hypothetical protein
LAVNDEVSLDLQRIQADAALGDSPLLFGEWGLATQFSATDQFLSMWADAQKLAYSQGAGWMVSGVSFFDVLVCILICCVLLQFWNFKVEESTAANNLSRQWFG